MIRIDRVVTRGGDGGQTSLGDGARVSKDHARIEAVGAVDEANAAIGLLRVHLSGDEAADAMLARLQNDLFDVGADLCVPESVSGRLRVTDAPNARLEAEIAAMNAELPPLTSFVLPGGSVAGAHAHLARTALRRAERRVVTLGHLEGINPSVIRLLNRASDHLFVLGRWVNDQGRLDVTWVPGANR